MFNRRVIRLFYNFWPEKFGRPFIMQKIIANAFDPIGIYLIYFIEQFSIDGNANFRNLDPKTYKHHQHFCVCKNEKCAISTTETDDFAFIHL